CILGHHWPNLHRSRRTEGATLDAFVVVVDNCPTDALL
ncbi:hypothetical protein V490_00246, partial [Pseudogymnoascus sp. VKM F-3557]